MKLETLFGWYKKQYNLPFIETRYNIQDSYAYTYCSDRRFFAIVIPFQTDRLIVVEHLISDFSRFGWSLIGGSVNEDKGEDFIDGAFNNTTKCIGKEIRSEEFHPIALLENTFAYNNQFCKHQGVAYIARINDTVNLENALRGTRCVRLDVNQKVSVTNINNKKVLDIAIERINKYKAYDCVCNEINRSYSFDFKKPESVT